MKLRKVILRDNHPNAVIRIPYAELLLIAKALKIATTDASVGGEASRLLNEVVTILQDSDPPFDGKALLKLSKELRKG
jgi:hypothetical protein